MTVSEARIIQDEFYENGNPKDEEVFLYTEAMNFLIEEEHKPADMLSLGGYYYEIKRFDLALKYYEMAATYDYDPAYECLGYIWYYGRTGERDFKKAYEYFSKLMEKEIRWLHIKLPICTGTAIILKRIRKSTRRSLRNCTKESRP